MLTGIDPIVTKEIFTIKDLSYVFHKQSQTIRKWEQKGIIPKCSTYGDNGWRQYNKQEFADVLEHAINYKWQRKTIINPGQIRLMINYLRK